MENKSENKLAKELLVCNSDAELLRLVGATFASKEIRKENFYISEKITVRRRFYYYSYKVAKV